MRPFSKWSLLLLLLKCNTYQTPGHWTCLVFGKMLLMASRMEMVYLFGIWTVLTIIYMLSYVAIEHWKKTFSQWQFLDVYYFQNVIFTDFLYYLTRPPLFMDKLVVLRHQPIRGRHAKRVGISPSRDYKPIVQLKSKEQSGWRARHTVFS